MFAQNRIRSQMNLAAAILLVVVMVMAGTSLMGSIKFRKLTKAIRGRANELPLAANLSLTIDDLRAELMVRRPSKFLASPSVSQNMNSIGLQAKLRNVQAALEDYKYQLRKAEPSHSFISDNSQELKVVAEIERLLSEMQQLTSTRTFFFDSSIAMPELDDRLQQLRQQTSQLPRLMQQRMDEFSHRARTEYHSWIGTTVLSSLIVGVCLFILYRHFNQRIFRPLETLVEGSRKVAAGHYDHRIHLDRDDEVAELARALNAMTQNFQEIQQDLNRQVQIRTREVVRSEKMASVGFLAAGVAHEINNPLASIAWSAESLESRIQDILGPHPDARPKSLGDASQIEDMQKYLRRIQDDAFRCKEITSALLDFSRMGDTEKTFANLQEIVQTVLEIVRPLSKYRHRQIDFHGDPTVQAQVNPQEINQVILNLITNALDSVADDGHVWIELRREGDRAVLEVRDDGCGMTDEVIEHLFEPFFTRRRDGQGTGLGLSITYQIIQDHHGEIVPQSDGPGCGSTFTVYLPIDAHEYQGSSIVAA